MRIVRMARRAGRYEFCVHTGDGAAYSALGPLIQLILELSRRGWPFQVADAKGLLLRIGPLTAAQSASLSQRWFTYVE